MPSIGTITKYLGLLSIGKSFIDKVVLQKLLAGVVKVIAAAVVAAILVGAMVITVLYGLYFALTESFPTLAHWGAALIVGAIAASLIAFIVYKVLEGVKTIASVSSVLIQTSMPASPLAPVTDIVNSFLDGFKTHEAKSSKALKKPTNFPKRVK